MYSQPSNQTRNFSLCRSSRELGIFDSNKAYELDFFWVRALFFPGLLCGGVEVFLAVGCWVLGIGLVQMGRVAEEMG